MKRLRVLHLVSCRGWSSDAYWAARVAVELERAGHEATLCCRAGAEGRVIGRVRELGVTRVETLALRGGVRLPDDLADLRRLSRWLPRFDLLHVHRGKEHWLAALANRLSRTPRPLIRTRHIVQAVRPHAGNRWLYRHGTDRVVTVTEAIRRQYLASGLLPATRVVSISGGVDADRFHPERDGKAVRAELGIPNDTPLVGLVSGFRAMKGHGVVVEAAARLASEGIRPCFLFMGTGRHEREIREAVREAGLEGQIAFAGFVLDLPGCMAALDIALYVPLESDGMGRVVFEYLAVGRPLVASRVGVVPEVLTDEREALLVPAGDPERLADALRRLLVEDGLRASLGLAGRRLVVDRYSGARVAARLADVYAEAAVRRRV